MKSYKGYFFFLPALIFLLMFFIIPFINAFVDTFFESNLVTRGKFIGFANYIKLFTDTKFWFTALNSFLLIIVTPVLIFLSLSFGLLIKENNSFNKILRQLYFLPVITPIVIVGIIWRWILSEDIGLANYLLNIFSINPVNWLSHYPVNLISIMLVTIWRGFGYYLMLMLAGITLIPKETEEAAVLDGAGVFKKVFYIIIPSLKPTIILIFVTSSSAAIKLFTEMYVMIPGAPISNKSLVSYLFQQSFEYFNFGYGSTIGIIIFLLTIGFSFINIKLLENK